MAEGTKPPPPTACSARAATSSQIDEDSPHSSEPRVNSPTHSRKIDLRPKVSLSLPASGSMTTCTS
jgi:hypothetical protein